MSRTSQVATKNVQVRADDFATSNSAVTVKSYNSTSTYDFYLPQSNPKYLDGVSGDLQVANQVYTYDVANNKYMWSRAASSSLFLQGQTDTIGNDDMGNVMSILREERVVAGDPLYDPSKDDDQQVFKAIYKFTDEMYNMKELTCGKKTIRTNFKDEVSQITFSGQVATATIDNGHSITNGQSVTISGADGDDKDIYNLSNVSVSNVTVGATTTTFEYALLSTPSAAATTSTKLEVTYTVASGVDQDKSTGLYFEYKSGSEPNLASVDEKKQMIDQLTLQTKNSSSGSDHTKFEIQPLKTTLSTVNSSNSTKSSVSLSQATQEISFHNDNSKYIIDNSTKKVSMDMETIEFGPSTDKHRLSIQSNKLFIQKWDGTAWVGADIVLDSNVLTRSTISISATNTIAGKIDVTATIGGSWDATNGDHWHVKLDDGTESMAMTGNSFQLDSTYIGTHQIVAYAADLDHKQISEIAVVSIVTTI